MKSGVDWHVADQRVGRLTLSDTVLDDVTQTGNTCARRQPIGADETATHEKLSDQVGVRSGKQHFFYTQNHGKIFSPFTVSCSFQRMHSLSVFQIQLKLLCSEIYYIFIIVLSVLLSFRHTATAFDGVAICSFFIFLAKCLKLCRTDRPRFANAVWYCNC